MLSNPSASLTRIGLLLRSVRTDFGFGLRVFQISKSRRHSPADCRSLAAILETSEVGTIAPEIWSAEPLPGCQRGIMHHVDQAFVIRIAHFVARKIAKISACRK